MIMLIFKKSCFSAVGKTAIMLTNIFFAHIVRVQVWKKYGILQVLPVF